MKNLAILVLSTLLLLSSALLLRSLHNEEISRRDGVLSTVETILYAISSEDLLSITSVGLLADSEKTLVLTGQRSNGVNVVLYCTGLRHDITPECRTQ